MASNKLYFYLRACSSWQYILYLPDQMGYKKTLQKKLAFGKECHILNNKQLLLDEVEHDSENYQGQGLCYLPKPKAEADNTNRGLDNFAIMRKPNPIIIKQLLFYYTFEKLNHHFRLNFAAFCHFFIRGLSSILICFSLPLMKQRLLHVYDVNRDALSLKFDA